MAHDIVPYPNTFEAVKIHVSFKDARDKSYTCKHGVYGISHCHTLKKAVETINGGVCKAAARYTGLGVLSRVTEDGKRTDIITGPMLSDGATTGICRGLTDLVIARHS